MPLLQAVPGVISIARFKTQELTMIMGGERRAIVVEDEPKFSAVYEGQWGVSADPHLRRAL